MEILHILVNISPLLFQTIRRAAIDVRPFRDHGDQALRRRRCGVREGRQGKGPKGGRSRGCWMARTRTTSPLTGATRPSLAPDTYYTPTATRCEKEEERIWTQGDETWGESPLPPLLIEGKKKFWPVFSIFFDFSFFQVSFPTRKTPFSAPSRGALSNGTKIVTPPPFPDLIHFLLSPKFTNALSKSLC